MPVLNFFLARMVETPHRAARNCIYRMIAKDIEDFFSCHTWLDFAVGLYFSDAKVWGRPGPDLEARSRVQHLLVADLLEWL
jgi:hypothetical protein